MWSGFKCFAVFPSDHHSISNNNIADSMYGLLIDGLGGSELHETDKEHDARKQVARTKRIHKVGNIKCINE